jgi:hypothetical protein
MQPSHVGSHSSVFKPTASSPKVQFTFYRERQHKNWGQYMFPSSHHITCFLLVYQNPSPFVDRFILLTVCSVNTSNYHAFQFSRSIKANPDGHTGRTPAELDWDRNLFYHIFYLYSCCYEWCLVNEPAHYSQVWIRNETFMRAKIYILKNSKTRPRESKKRRPDQLHSKWGEEVGCMIWVKTAARIKYSFRFTKPDGGGFDVKLYNHINVHSRKTLLKS